MKNILILQGPNLNLLGVREPSHYGFETLAQIHEKCQSQARELKIQLECFQSNCEEKLIEKIHSSLAKVDLIIINPAGLTHTSVVLRDALLAVAIPFIEVHLSNIFSREDFRHHSYFSDKALAVVSGMGSFGYTSALNFAANYFKTCLNKN